MSEDRPLDADEFERWRLEADHALKAAAPLGESGPFNWACFLLEQAAQLAVKALLHGTGAAPWGHDLEVLGRRLADAGIDVPVPVSDALARLGRHYIPARYPDAHALGPAASHYRRSDADEASGDAKVILRFVDNV